MRLLVPIRATYGEVLGNLFRFPGLELGGGSGRVRRLTYGGDPWLPNPQNSFIQSEPVGGLENAKVCSL